LVQLGAVDDILNAYHAKARATAPLAGATATDHPNNSLCE